MEEITLSINKTRISCPSGATILEAAEQNGIKIPKLCYHPELKPFGACRLCLVEDEASGRVMASCVTPAAAKMEILTDSPRVISHRRNIVRLMMAEHPESCVVCSKGNRCQLREIAARMGLGDSALYPIPNYRPIEQANPFITRDLSKCILCGKCIRADHELVATGAIDYNLRGFKSRPATLLDSPLEASTCTFCGVCVSICPTGALSPKTDDHAGTPEREALTTCGFCGVGCSIFMGVSDGRVMEINPSAISGSVNGSTLCVRGHFAHDFLNDPERLTHPMVRGSSGFEAISWDDAIAKVAEKLSAIKKDYGPQSIGFFGSSKCTNEENYLFQKMARTLFGTNNLDNGGAMAGRSTLQIIDECTGGRHRINPLANLDQAEAILVLGADPCHSAPVLSYHLKRAAKAGVPLIGVDLRKTGLFPFSTLWLTPSPDRDHELINCLAALVWKKFAHDSSFIEQFTEGFGSYRDALSSFNPERLCVASGSDMKSLNLAADLVKGKKISFVVGSGITQANHGVHSMKAVLNLSLMTGSLGGGSGGLHVIVKENNQMGAWDMGTVPDALPGRVPLVNDPGRKDWERAWDAKISPDRGLDVFRMIEEAERKNLKALFIMGENPLRSLPQTERVEKALSALDLLVVQDILQTETTLVADVVLPGAAFSEKGGSFTNMEGRISCFSPATRPPGDAKPDWEILDRLAFKTGSQKTYGSLDSIRAEMGRLIPMYAGLAENSDEPWTWIRKIESDEPLRFSALPPTDAEEMDDDYPLTAIFGSIRFHLGSGTRTSHSKRINDFRIKGPVAVSKKDGDRLHIKNGDTVRVHSREGTLTREAQIDRNLKEGRVFVPTAFNQNDALNLVGLSTSGHGPPKGLKTCRVRLEKSGENQ